jgi:hypothetical protein
VVRFRPSRRAAWFLFQCVQYAESLHNQQTDQE